MAGRVSVRQVVTRTVTYCRTPLEPAPRGKRRKIEVDERDSKAAAEEPKIKKEKHDEPEASTSASIDQKPAQST
jgi:hypothetical protein